MMMLDDKKSYHQNEYNMITSWVPLPTSNNFTQNYQPNSGAISQGVPKVWGTWMYVPKFVQIKYLYQSLCKSIKQVVGLFHKINKNVDLVALERRSGDLQSHGIRIWIGLIIWGSWINTIVVIDILVWTEVVNLPTNCPTDRHCHP